uniref:Family with sequence similarity 234 member A n=1 Tax=Erpetoichthys calabaricus TaxID=27687 RepID=A0A8C4T6I7_ERPCA
MTDAKDHETEVHPLKNEEGVPPNTPSKKGIFSTGSKLSRWRTAAFFVSLFLGLIVVFAFSFIIPCPVRPVSQRTWKRSYEDASTFNILGILDANNDKVNDVIFAFKASDNLLNVSCSDEGFLSPCVFLTVICGRNGSVLSLRPVSQDQIWARCDVSKLGGVENPSCLLYNSQDLLVIDSKTDSILWRKNNSQNFKTPVLTVPDIDQDGVEDLAVITSTGDSTTILFISGKSGIQIGSQVDLNLQQTSGHLIYLASRDSYYILFKKGSAIHGYALKNILALAMKGLKISAGLQEDSSWRLLTVNSTNSVIIHYSDLIQHVFEVPNKDKTSRNLLVITDHQLEIINGKTLNPLWKKFNASAMIRETAFGYFNNDEIVDVIAEEEYGNNTKKVAIYDGATGSSLWEIVLKLNLKSPKPSTVKAADHRSVFLFWGRFLDVDSSSLDEQQFLYWLHPSHPKVLLELRNTTEEVVVFQALLFEKSRHAGYILLSGSTNPMKTGNVTLFKGRFKEDISHSRVINLGEETFTDQEIRDIFLRMRYSSE